MRLFISKQEKQAEKTHDRLMRIKQFLNLTSCQVTQYLYRKTYENNDCKPHDYLLLWNFMVMILYPTVRSCLSEGKITPRLCQSAAQVGIYGKISLLFGNHRPGYCILISASTAYIHSYCQNAGLPYLEFIDVFPCLGRFLLPFIIEI